uniref:Uncharacterized protein n=1 Tax=Octopus bimaculoides TaxID=37653 RepID=A0A0L8GGU0_OCTBM
MELFCNPDLGTCNKFQTQNVDFVFSLCVTIDNKLYSLSNSIKSHLILELVAISTSDIELNSSLLRYKCRALLL